MSVLKREGSPNWICGTCTFENDKREDECTMCGVINPFKPQKKIKRIPLLESVPLKSQDSEGHVICHFCTFKNKILSTRCEVCSKCIFGDIQEEIKVAPERREDMLACPHCKFSNHKANETCVACESFMDQSDGEKYSDGLLGEEELITSKCPLCDCEISSFNYKSHLKDCKESMSLLEKMRQDFPGDINDEECLYCYQKLGATLLEHHYSICKEKKTFFDDDQTFGRMTPLQKQAMEFMYQNCEKQHYGAKPRLVKRIRDLGYTLKDIEAVHHYIENYAPIIVHIHASRYMGLFVKDTHYRNQFETNTSSGSLSSTARIGWEDRMFTNRYHKANKFERVKYGAINLTNDPKGIQCCVGYGNSYFMLKESVRKRCTFTDMDSSSASSKIGVFKFGLHVIEGLSDPEMKAVIEGAKAMEVSSNVVATYKEIQIHGPLDLSQDIERLYVNQVQLSDPIVLQHVKEFSNKFKVDYEVFKSRDPASPVLPFSIGGVILAPRSKGRIRKGRY